jgi:hypothetical protein
MADKMQCSIHGEREQTFVCSHLTGDNFALGFNQAKHGPENLYPDAWCDDCEVIRASHGGWNEKSEKLLKVKLLCSGCYERARIRNTHTATTLDDLGKLRWKCSSCDAWHEGPCLDFAYFSPNYWSHDLDEENKRARLSLGWSREKEKTFLDEDYCAIRGEHFFIRGLIQLPIIGTGRNFCWGVWGSLSSANFQTLIKVHDDTGRVELPPMFSWLSTVLPGYPETLSLKMYAHVRDVGLRPYFELEPSDHPLSLEQYSGISPERVKQIMLSCLREAHEANGDR